MEKPFWKSVSFWMTILTIVGLVFDKLIMNGVLPNEGWVGIVSLVIGLIVKRGIVDQAVVKTDGLKSIAKIAKNGAANVDVEAAKVPARVDPTS